jgi:hypothetical protein
VHRDDIAEPTARVRLFVIETLFDERRHHGVGALNKPMEAAQRNLPGLNQSALGLSRAPSVQSLR